MLAACLLPLFFCSSVATHQQSATAFVITPFNQAIAFQRRRGNGLDSRQQISRIQSSSRLCENEKDNAISNKAVGLYRPFAEHAWSKLLEETDWFRPDASVPSELSSNVAPAKGFPEGSIVQIELKALRPKTAEASSVVRYARYALLETLVPSNNDNDNSHYNSTVGIQVLNLVIFPSEQTNLPVFGADLVSLPGDKHLILLDAQPMEDQRRHQHHWKEWYHDYVIGSNPEKPNFVWGGDIPEQVAKYVSDYALWTRLGGAAAAASNNKERDPSNEKDTEAVIAPTTVIQTQVWDAFQKHLAVYLGLLQQCQSSSESGGRSRQENDQEPYIDYRLNNDPAKPMLKSLYGEEYTERVLQEVLFPQQKQHE